MTGRGDIVRSVTGWLNDLAAMTAGTAPVADLKAKVAAMAPGLIEEIPADAFSKRSLYDVGRKFKFFPSYAELSAALTDWWEANAPRQKYLPPVEDPNLTDTDRAHVRSWLDLRDAGSLDRRLAQYRDKWPAAYRYVVRTDAEAEAIARRRGWDISSGHEWNVTPEWITRTLVTIQRIHAAATPGDVASAAGKLGMLRTAVEKHAPDLKHLVPEEIPLTAPERPRSVDQQLADLGPAAVAAEVHARLTKDGRLLGALTPEQLSAARKAAGMPDMPEKRPVPPAPEPPDDWVFPWEREAAP